MPLDIEKLHGQLGRSIHGRPHAGSSTSPFTSGDWTTSQSEQRRGGKHTKTKACLDIVDQVIPDRLRPDVDERLLVNTWLAEEGNRVKICSRVVPGRIPDTSETGLKESLGPRLRTGDVVTRGKLGGHPPLERCTVGHVR